jgi:hypothetical protein
MKLRAGDWVEVRSKEEILRSLDENGRLEGLPFMPQMFQYCGQRFRVYKRAHKTCDTVNGTGGRWLANGIHLDLRCDGKAYGGCQAACLIFWKDAWLKRVGDGGNPVDTLPSRGGPDISTLVKKECLEKDVWKATRAQDPQSPHESIYYCQATQLPYFTTHLQWWDLRQYMEDFVSRNVTLGRMLRGFVYVSYYPLCRQGRSQLEPLRLFFRWLYDRFQAMWGGVHFPRKRGLLPPGQSAPISSLNLQPGELVRIKRYEEILKTIGSRFNKNHGLFFDAELVPYCGHIYRVRTRIDRFIDERTGKMVSLKMPAVILEGVWCKSRYSDCRMGCPRSIYSWWREVWLERVPEGHERPVLKECGRDTEPGGPLEKPVADESWMGCNRAAERSGEVRMAGQPGFLDRDRQYAALSAAGDPFERLAR